MDVGSVDIVANANVLMLFEKVTKEPLRSLAQMKNRNFNFGVHTSLSRCNYNDNDKDK